MRGTRIKLDPRDSSWWALMGVTMAEAPTVSIINASVFRASQMCTIRAPALLLLAANETLYNPRATLKLAAARMPGLDGAVIQDADHLAAMAQPDEVNSRIISFCGGHERLRDRFQTPSQIGEHGVHSRAQIAQRTCANVRECAEN